MTVYDYLELINDLSSVAVSIFGLNSGEVLFETEGLDAPHEVPDDLQDYEVCSVDLYLDGGKMHLEINIDDVDDD